MEVSAIFDGHCGLYVAVPFVLFLYLLLIAVEFLWSNQVVYLPPDVCLPSSQRWFSEHEGDILLAGFGGRNSFGYMVGSQKIV
ncbi:unnamed protein product [Victoria cruziana]